jgi:hypothetical protein
MPPLFGRTIAYASSPPEGKGKFSLFLFYALILFYRLGGDGSGDFGGVVT